MGKNTGPASPALLKAIAKHQKEQTVSVMLRLNKNQDAELIEKLESVDSKMGYIKNLIRRDLGLPEK